MQLVKSLSREAAEELHIPTDALRRFRYLRRSGCTSIAGTDDVADFHLVQHAMDAVNIDKKAQVGCLGPSCCGAGLPCPLFTCTLCSSLLGVRQWGSLGTWQEISMTLQQPQVHK